MNRWLTIIGVGDDGVAGLPPATRALLEGAEIIVGSERLLSHLSKETARRYPWTSPLSDMMSKIADWRGRRVVVLATGDPMHFGVGVTLLKHFSADEAVIVPNLSAFTLAAARLGVAAAGSRNALASRPRRRSDPAARPSRREAPGLDRRRRDGRSGDGDLAGPRLWPEPAHGA